MQTFQGIKAGDLVRYLTPQGQIRKGRAGLLLLFPNHVVINTGGPFGTPAVVNAQNYHSHKSR